MLFERIKQLCSTNGTSISKLEKSLNFGNGTISKWERAKPSIEKVVAVAEYFSVSIDYLVKDNPFPTYEGMEIARRFDTYSDEQKNLLKCYLSIIENSKTG